MKYISKYDDLCEEVEAFSQCTIQRKLAENAGQDVSGWDCSPVDLNDVEFEESPVNLVMDQKKIVWVGILWFMWIFVILHIVIRLMS